MRPSPFALTPIERVAIETILEDRPESFVGLSDRLGRSWTTWPRPAKGSSRPKRKLTISSGGSAASLASG